MQMFLNVISMFKTFSKCNAFIKGTFHLTMVHFGPLVDELSEKGTTFVPFRY